MNDAQRRAVLARAFYHHRTIHQIKSKNVVDETTFEPWEVVVLYHCAIGAAALLALTCPVLVVDHRDEQQVVTSTVAWDETTAAWKTRYLVEAGVLMGTISLAFFVLHGSDPGWLKSSSATTAVAAMDSKNMEDTSSGGAVVAGGGEGNNNNNSSTSTPYRREWCRVCRLAPPLRAHHCRLCDCCVATFDHHCEFVGTCIGERNRCRFWWLLLAQVVGVGRCCTMVLVLFVVEYDDISSSGEDDDNNHNKNSLVWFLLSVLKSWYSLWQARRYGRLLRLVAAQVYVLVLAIAAVFLFVVHTMMALTNSTTFEFGKSRHLAYYNNNKPYHFPFHQGTVRRNLQVYGCGLHLQWMSSLFSSAGTSHRNNNNNNNKWKPILWDPPTPRVVSARKPWWKWKGKD